MARDQAALDGCAAALAGLPNMGPNRLTTIVRKWGFVEGWELVRSGRIPPAKVMPRTSAEVQRAVIAEWVRAAAALEPRAVREAHRAAGIGIVTYGSDRFPSVLAADIEPPMVIFTMGDPEVLIGTRVGVVGTRRATGGGRQTAADIGHRLAAAGVRVVSGLALGIDGAAHQGALRATDDGAPASAVGVVATGLDVVYPTRHAELWRAIGRRGLLVSEWPLGTPPAKWRFPARNRIIAALSDLLVVVESHAKGGALLTVDEAMQRDRPVLVVPGSVRSAASEGTNELLVSGATPVCRPDDILRELDLSSCSRSNDQAGMGEGESQGEPPPALDPGDGRLLDSIGWEPVALDTLAGRCGLELGDLSLRLMRLEGDGRIRRTGSTIEQVDIT
ncbi:MAG: DNA-protecting protein DprA [Acidimicrobiia bacterium]|nr:DNA-protecting protein DprA [Acidimicrobiia bacterium]